MLHSCHLFTLFLYCSLLDEYATISDIYFIRSSWLTAPKSFGISLFTPSNASLQYCCYCCGDGGYTHAWPWDSHIWLWCSLEVAAVLTCVHSLMVPLWLWYSHIFHVPALTRSYTPFVVLTHITYCGVAFGWRQQSWAAKIVVDTCELPGIWTKGFTVYLQGMCFKSLHSLGPRFPLLRMSEVTAWLREVWGLKTNVWPLQDCLFTVEQTSVCLPPIFQILFNALKL